MAMAIPQQALALVHSPSTSTLSLTTLPVPTPSGRDEHLVRVRAVAITNGELAWPEPQTVDHPIPGYEMAGVVELAPADSPFPNGTEVYARTDFDRPGSSRAFTITRTAEMGRKPSNLGWEAAAAVPLSALTAWQALFVHGGLAPPTFGGEDGKKSARSSRRRVLVTGAAGGVGLFAVQLAHLAGAYVVGTCGPSNLEFVRGLGADAVLNYRNLARSLEEELGVGDENGFDLVIDGVGGKTLEEAWCCAKADGMVISIVLPAHLKKPLSGVRPDVRSVWFIVDADRSQLEKITELLADARLVAQYDSAYDLARFEEAFSKVREGHVRGKVVLILPDNGVAARD